MRTVREEVGSATYGRGQREAPGDGRLYTKSGPTERSVGSNTAAGSSSQRLHGPTLPTPSDLVLAREASASQAAAERAYARKRSRAEEKEHVEDMIGPKAVGKEALLEKKRAKRESDRSFRDGRDEGFEVDESTLLGGGDSFREQYVLVLSFVLTPHLPCLFKWSIMQF